MDEKLVQLDRIKLNVEFVLQSWLHKFNEGEPHPDAMALRMRKSQHIRKLIKELEEALSKSGEWCKHDVHGNDCYKCNPKSGGEK